MECQSLRPAGRQWNIWAYSFSAKSASLKASITLTKSRGSNNFTGLSPLEKPPVYVAIQELPKNSQSNKLHHRVHSLHCSIFMPVFLG
jgi:hypothetical protein